MIFCLPSTLVLRRRRINWKFDFSPETSAVYGVSIPESRYDGEKKKLSARWLLTHDGQCALKLIADGRSCRREFED